MIAENKKISCLRCGRVLADDERRCSICLKKEKLEELQKIHNGLNDVQNDDEFASDSSQKNSIFKWFLIALFAFYIFGMIVGFFREFHENGLISAAKNKGAILWVCGTFLIIHLLGSREWLEKHGLGFIHKLLRYICFLLFILIALMMIGVVFSSIGVGGSSGLPDNIRM